MVQGVTMGALGSGLLLGPYHLKPSVLFSGQGHQGPDVPGQLVWVGFLSPLLIPTPHHQSGLRDMLISVGVHSLSQLS